MAAVPQASPVTDSTATQAGATRQLAAFIAGLRPQDIPAPVAQVMSNGLLDAVGSGLHGLTLPWARIIHGFAAEQGGPPEASLWAGGGKKISAMNAALCAGTAIHSFDFDDHSRAKIHPGAVVVSAALALGQRENISGARLLTAIAAGYETMQRVSLAANPSSSRLRGWHLTGTTGTFAAAAACAVILGLDAEATASALGLAGTQSAGLWAFNVDGAMSKRLHPGNAAHNGMMSALLAARGFHGPRAILEAEDGGFLNATSDDVRLGEITRGLGSEWRSLGVCFKPHACCGSNHSSIDAVVGILADEGLRAGDVDHVVVGVSRVVEVQTGFVYRPTTVLNAQMSLRYDIAVAMLDGQAYLEQFTEQRIVDRDTNELAARVRVERDAEMDAVYPELYAGKVTVVTRAGKRIARRVDYSKGMPENPMSRTDLERKFLSLAGYAVGEQQAREVLAALGGAFEGAGVAALNEGLGGLTLLKQA